MDVKITDQQPQIYSQLVFEPAPLEDFSPVHVKPKWNTNYFFTTVL